MRFRKFIPWLFLLAACSGKESVPQVDPVLKSVFVGVTELNLEPGGSVTVPFSVTDPAFAFNHDPASPGFQLCLLRQGGQVPATFRITAVTAGQPTGSYEAVITDLDSGERYEERVRLAVREANDAFVGSAYFTVRSEGRTPEPAPADYLATGLPVVYVNTEGGAPIVSKVDDIPATLSIDDADGKVSFETATCRIRGRGNTTWEWPKKPYLIKLDEKASVLGMPKHKRWVLLANFMDRTLMRNMVSMKVASLTSLDWTPRSEPVELVLNGRHMGTYLLIEQVRVDKNRVPITEMKPTDIAGEALTGGYLLELDFHFDNEVQWIDPHGRAAGIGGGIPFGIKSPDSEDLAPEQLSYIKGYISEAASALYGPDFTDPEKGYARYLDVDSFIDYWLVYEVMCNHELGNPGSVYMHKDRGGLLKAGPCWDFDWGILSFYTSNGQYGLVNGKAIWYERLFQDPAFKARVKARFEQLLPQLETIPAYMDACEAQLAASARLNFAMWNPADDRSMNGGQIINGDENMSFHDAVARLKDNYNHHLQIIRSAL